MSILGRIFVPALAEKTIGWTRTITFCTLICAACFLWLIGVKEPWMLYVFVIIYGFFYGGKVPLIPATLRFFFGTKALGRLSGAAHAISLVGGALGPVLAGYIVDVSGSYLIAFLVGAVFWVAAGVLAWFVRQPTVSVKEKVCFFKE
jgi:MFS family permease